MAAERPVTSKARGICMYYATPRGCFAGDKCKFLHGEQERLTPFDKSKPCRFYAAGYCKRGAQCWFLHVPPAQGSSMAPAPAASTAEDESDFYCSICYEKPVTYGLLAGCSHIFCLECIKAWRDKRDKAMEVIMSGVIKTCPMCRAPSKFITPSSVFYPHEHPHKAVTIENYKASMARVPCKFFTKSPPEARMCPFGKDCFYQHLNEDGTRHDFKKGVDYYTNQRRRYWNLDREVTESINESILASLQAALNRFRASIEGLPGLGDIPDDAFDAETIMASEMVTMPIEELHPAVPLSAVSALAESVLSSLGTEEMRPRATRVLGPGDLLSELVGTFHEARPVPWVVSMRSRSLDPYDILQRPPEIMRAPTPSTSDPNSSHDEEPVVLDYGSDDTLIAPDNSGDRSGEEGSAQDTPAAAENPTIPEVDTDPQPAPSPSLLDTDPAVPGPSLEHATTEPADAPVVVHDSDPPFTTDGRGRVVWSSTSARGRAVRSRTSSGTAVPAPPQPRDKPRDGPSSDLRS